MVQRNEDGAIEKEMTRPNAALCEEGDESVRAHKRNSQDLGVATFAGLASFVACDLA